MSASRVAHDYLHAIVRRAREPMAPLGFDPDWRDQPWRHKRYDGAVRIPLPASTATPGAARVGTGLTGGPAPAGNRFDLRALAALLHDSYGLNGRRLAVHANPDQAAIPSYRNATWSRGTASGGGLYPLEIYWVCGAGGPLLPGVYYYSTPHHAMQRLVAGDVADQVRAALGGDQPTGTDQFLLVTVKLWKNAFKYNSFTYHVVTMDLGALLGTWQTWSRAHGLPLRPALVFDEPAVNQLLGLPTDAESVLAVVPVPWVGPDADPPPAHQELPQPSRPRVTRQEVERSRRVIQFDVTGQLHRATLDGADARSVRRTLASAGAVEPAPAEPDTLRLPPPLPLDTDVTSALRARRSSFGRFASRPPLSQAQLSTVLAAGWAGGRLRSDVKDPDGVPGLTRLVAFVNHVQGVPPGSYAYLGEGGSLRLVEPGDAGPFLQRSYFLHNYSLTQAAAVVAVLARPEAVLDAVGARGYRFVNAEVGAVCQATYVACASLGLGCGAALGFDNVSYAEQLRLDGGEWPLLILMIGNERQGGPDVDHRIA